MAFFRNPPPLSGQVGVNPPEADKFASRRWAGLCDVLQYVSAQSLDFRDLAKKSPFLNWKLSRVQNPFVGGHARCVFTQIRGPIPA